MLKSKFSCEEYFFFFVLSQLPTLTSEETEDTGQILLQGESEVSNFRNYSKIFSKLLCAVVVDVWGACYWREETKGFSSQLLKFQLQIPISEEVSIPSSKFSILKTGRWEVVVKTRKVIKTSDDNQSIPDFSGCSWRLAPVDLKIAEISSWFWAVQFSLLYKTFNYSLIKSASVSARQIESIYELQRERAREREIADSCICIK